ncbi:alpha/beta fold hydrolase [Ornithinimicrobium sp. F0845]|uniref:alpha/beta hydrolase n=1 Tax=Ornithinimicrobium sp. F0845 TaxID=2926412 RepID=UPI001FF37830|nr:alpha/beta fold hydrolase [Ornithinimicrobium sp. F0845]
MVDDSLLSRRAVLAGGLAVLAGASGLSACQAPAEGGRAPVQEGRLTTKYWSGYQPRWLLVRPEGATATVVALHGAGGDAGSWFEPPRAQAVAQQLGIAVAAVDGGHSYWHARADGSDTGTMVLEDLLPTLEREGAPVDQVGLTGFSMGGYGALLLATRLPPERVLGVAAVSAALFFTEEEAAVGAFDGADDFARHDIFDRVEALRELPVWLACGGDDTFAVTNRALAQRLPDAVTEFDAGGHDQTYLEAHWQRGMAFLADQLPAR